MKELRNQLISEMYKSIYNCKIRLHYHLQQNIEIILREEEAKSSQNSISDSDKKTLEYIQHIKEQLESSILHIDETLLLLLY